MLSPSLASSNLTAAGLVQAFSGDVVIPTERQRGNVATLIDRYPQSVLSFVDLRNASIRGQIDVSSGFAANPHDAVTLADGRILVTRFDTNLGPDVVASATGGDIVVLSANNHEVESRIEFASALPHATGGLLPHPDRMLVVRSTVYVVVALYTADYRRTGPSYLLTIDANSLVVTGTLELVGLSGCSGLSVAPDATQLAVVCAGHWSNPKGALASSSGLVGIDIFGAPRESWRLLATELSPALPFGFSVAYASVQRVLTVTLGRFADSTYSAERDRFVSYDVKTNQARIVFAPDGNPFVLGDVRCFPRCGHCALANAEGRGKVMVFEVFGEELSLISDLPSSPELGLPPRWLGTF